MTEQAQTQTAVATCLACGHGISLKSGSLAGRKVRCSNCNALFQVLKKAPVELEWFWEEWDKDELDEW